MEVAVTPASLDDKPVVRRLLEFNAHDLAAIDGRRIGPHGEYGYRYLDHYWDPDEDRHPFLLRVDGQLAGCALVRAGDPHELAEFFVLRSHRRTGVGTAAAAVILGRFPGAWQFHVLDGHTSARDFWRRAIPAPYDEEEGATGTTFRFSVAMPPM